MIPTVLAFICGCVAFVSFVETGHPIAEYEPSEGVPSMDSLQDPIYEKEETRLDETGRGDAVEEYDSSVEKYKSSPEEGDFDRVKSPNPLSSPFPPTQGDYEASTENSQASTETDRTGKKVAFPECEYLQRAFARLPLIAGGDDVIRPQKYSWMLALHKKKRGRFKFSCGASIIGSRWVLTAAHCLRNKNAKTRNGNQGCLNKHGLPVPCFVTPGDIQFGCVDTQGARRELRARRLYPHEQYAVDGHHHDIGLVELEEDLPMGKNVPLCLSKGSDMDHSKGNTFLLGWGRVDHDTAGKSEFLKMAEMDVLPQRTCEKMKNRTNTLCANGKNYDAISCNGDSGGPLIHKEHGLYYVIGVTNTGAKDCNISMPSSFAAVSGYVPWIKGIIEGKALQSI